MAALLPTQSQGKIQPQYHSFDPSNQNYGKIGNFPGETSQQVAQKPTIPTHPAPLPSDPSAQFHLQSTTDSTTRHHSVDLHPLSGSPSIEPSTYTHHSFNWKELLDQPRLIFHCADHCLPSYHAIDNAMSPDSNTTLGEQYMMLATHALTIHNLNSSLLAMLVLSQSTDEPQRLRELKSNISKFLSNLADKSSTTVSNCVRKSANIQQEEQKVKSLGVKNESESRVKALQEENKSSVATEKALAPSQIATDHSSVSGLRSDNDQESWFRRYWGSYPLQRLVSGTNSVEHAFTAVPI